MLETQEQETSRVSDVPALERRNLGAWLEIHEDPWNPLLTPTLARRNPARFREIQEVATCLSMKATTNLVIKPEDLGFPDQNVTAGEISGGEEGYLAVGRIIKGEKKLVTALGFKEKS